VNSRTLKRQSLSQLAAKHGAIVEEDEGTSDMRLFQVIAPAGKIWKGADLHTLVVQWARGGSDQAIRFNQDSFKDVAERMSHGLRDMTEEERELCAED
jgi:hypothetical protein